MFPNFSWEIQHFPEGDFYVIEYIVQCCFRYIWIFSQHLKYLLLSFKLLQ